MLKINETAWLNECSRKFSFISIAYRKNHPLENPDRSIALSRILMQENLLQYLSPKINVSIVLSII
jgi:hypothetical protein